MKTAIIDGKEVEVIDCTPTWEGLMPGFLAIMHTGPEKARQAIIPEFFRMAKALDQANELLKERKQNKIAFEAWLDTCEPLISKEMIDQIKLNANY